MADTYEILPFEYKIGTEEPETYIVQINGKDGPAFVTIAEAENYIERENKMNTTDKQIEAWLAAGRGPFTSEELFAAFQKLDFEGKHWKDNIDMEIPKDQREVLSYAVPWYCGGTPPEFKELENGNLRMTHAGYWHYIGS